MTEKEIYEASRFFAIGNFGLGDAKDKRDMERLWQLGLRQHVDEVEGGGTPGIEGERRSWEKDIREENPYCIKEWDAVKAQFGF